MDLQIFHLDLPSLTRLELGEIGVTSINFHDASLDLRNLPNLTTLILGDYVFDLPNLTTLILGDYVFDSPPTAVISDLPKLKEIHLGISALYFYKTKSALIEDLPSLESIESLGTSLVGSRITINS